MALTADAEVKEIVTSIGFRRPYLMTASTTIYAGAIVAVDTTTGLALPAADNAVHGVVGIAAEAKVSDATTPTWITVKASGDFVLPAASAAQTLVGSLACVVDDAAVDEAAGTANAIPVGRCVRFIDANSVVVAVRN